MWNECIENGNDFPKTFQNIRIKDILVKVWMSILINMRNTDFMSHSVIKPVSGTLQHGKDRWRHGRRSKRGSRACVLDSFLHARSIRSHVYRSGSTALITGYSKDFYLRDN